MPARKRNLGADNLAPLYARPGFLLRRAHQIAVGIFVEECAAIPLTPPQHGVLIAADRHPGVSQARLARLIGFDRATVGQVVKGLEARGLLHRLGSAADKRNKAVALTPQGRQILRRAASAMARTSQRLLAPFKPKEREVLMTLLTRLTDELNAASRTPLTGGGE